MVDKPPLPDSLQPPKPPADLKLPAKPKLPGAKGLGQPTAGFLNPETGEATSVRPDPAGWPKAEVSPAAPKLELPDLPVDKPEPPGAPKAPVAGAPKVPGPPDLGLDAPALPEAPKGLDPVMLANPETGETTKISPDPAGWPKAEIGQAPPDPLKALLGEMPKPPAAGAPPKAPGMPAPPPGPGKPEIKLPGAKKETIVEGLETGDVTSITPDSANWPKASVTPGTPKMPTEVPADLEAPKPEMVQKLADQAVPAPKIPK